MKSEQVAIESLSQDPANVREHDQRNIDAIKASLLRFGQQKPIVVDSDGVVIAGNGTLGAAKLLGWEKIAVVRTSLEGAEAVAYAIADNRSAELATWDETALALVLDQFDEPQLEAAGFSDEELGEMLERLDPTGGEVEEVEAQMGRAEELNEKWKVKRGDLWHIGNHRLLCGDATSGEDVERLMDGEKANLMVTDPPYGVNYNPAWRADAGINVNKDKLGKVTNDDQCDWRSAWALFSGNVVYCYHAGLFAGDVADSFVSCGFELKSQIIWCKDRFALSRADYHWKHEPCWYLIRKGKRHDWNSDRKQTTLWEINRADDSGHGHGTQKPIECMARPIRNHNGDVYDPFLGSGTTMVAAEQLNRKCYGMEIEPKYCAVILERMSDMGLEPRRVQ